MIYVLSILIYTLFVLIIKLSDIHELIINFYMRPITILFLFQIGKYMLVMLFLNEK